MNVGVNNRATAINQIFVGVNNIDRIVYGNSGGSEPKPSFSLLTLTGSSSTFGNETSDRVELYKSGTLTLFPGTYDMFLRRKWNLLKIC